jgi:flagellar biosynthetic protein FliR
MSALLLAAPILGFSQVNVKLRVLLSLVLTVMIMPMVAENFHVVYTNGLMLLVDVMREVLIGLTIGFGARLIFQGFAMAGHYIGMQMGMAIMQVFDPSSNQQQPFISHFWLLIMVVFFLVTNSHYFLIETIYLNFMTITPKTVQFSPHLGQTIIEGGSVIFNLAMQFAAPTIVILLLIDVSVAFMARVMPQLNVFFISLPMKIGIGIFLLIISLRIFQTIFGYLFALIQSYVLSIMKGLGA